MMLVLFAAIFGCLVGATGVWALAFPGNIVVMVASWCVGFWLGTAWSWFLRDPCGTFAGKVVRSLSWLPCTLYSRVWWRE